ncbi:hypothetical protein [Pseudomonas huanghezhanensis]|uniref:hypothetical protein n=1 Tax=Pseudomonas huanghezhanensis TaxID=3002903 RepID=UPI0022858D50|nr:hypothetical protein [Pseudomonas sp. BSw22131]
MQIQVINSSGDDDSSDVIGTVIAGLKQTPDGLPIVHAGEYAADGLVGILEVRAVRGEREILVVDCSRAHVQSVLEWNSCDDDRKFEDVVIHLVRKQEEQNYA